VAVEDDQRRPALGLAKDRERVFDPLEIVGIADAQHVPAVSLEARCYIFGEGDACLALDGDVIVVVDPAQVVELEMAGQRGRLRTDAFHQAAVAANRIDVIVEHLDAGPVVAAGQPLARDRHADAGGDPLPQRTGRRLDPRHPVIFRVSRRLALELAEVADVVERDRRLAQAFILGVDRLGAGEMQDRPQQHRGMAVRQNEAVAIRPDRILRIETHDPVPQRIDQRRQGHRRTGMARLRLLDGVDGQRANRVDRQLIELFLGHAMRLPFLHRRFARLLLGRFLDMTAELVAHRREQLVGEIALAP
jgi:hypothetical protein